MPKARTPLRRYTRDSRDVIRVLLALERLVDLQSNHTEVITCQEQQLSRE